MLKMDYGAAEIDFTTFGNTGKRRKAGLTTAEVSHSGFWNADAGRADDRLFTQLSLEDVLSIGVTNGADGERAFTLSTVQFGYSPGGDVGGAFKFEASAMSNAELIRGTVMHNATRTATGNGTARQLGSVGATQKLYAALHVLAVAGTTPTLDVKIQSDDAVGMASPADRITFTQATAAGAQSLSANGAIADDWFRVVYTIGGTAPSFLFVVVVGIK